MRAEAENREGNRRESEATAATNASKKDKRRRSSFLTRARHSFVRSGGNRGASVETLRGTHGADFEGKAIVKRGKGTGITCNCFGSSDKEVLALIKGPFLFVFKNETSSSPLYAVSLAHLKPVTKEEAHGNTTVELQTGLGDVEYEVIFHTAGNHERPRMFANMVTHQAAAGEAEEVRKRLGHDALVKKRASQLYAESVAATKIKDQPEKPVSVADEIAANIIPNAPAVAPY